MITTSILMIIIGFLSIPLAVVSLTATSVMPENFLTALQTYIGYTYAFDAIFPVTWFWVFFAYMMAFETSVLLYRAGMWIFDIIRHALRG